MFSNLRFLSWNNHGLFSTKIIYWTVHLVGKGLGPETKYVLALTLTAIWRKNFIFCGNHSLPRSIGNAAMHDAIMYSLFRCWPVVLIHRNGLPMCFLWCPSTTTIIVWIWLRCYRSSGKPPNLFNKIQEACKNSCSFFGITCTILDTVEMNLEK